MVWERWDNKVLGLLKTGWAMIIWEVYGVFIHLPVLILGIKPIEKIKWKFLNVEIMFFVKLTIFG